MSIILVSISKSFKEAFWQWVYAWLSLLNDIILIVTFGIVDFGIGIEEIIEKIQIARRRRLRKKDPANW